MASSSPASYAMRQPSPMSSNRAQVMDRYRRMRKQRTSTPKASSTPKVADENHQPRFFHHATPLRAGRTAGASPLSPRNNSSSSAYKTFSDVKPTPPLPSRIRPNVLTTPSPLATAPSPTSSVTSSARRERRERHAKLLGTRGGRTPRGASLSTTASLAGDTPTSTTNATPNANTSISRRAALRKAHSTSTISNYYSHETLSTTKKPPKTPASSSAASVSSACKAQDASEVSKRVRERRARGAKKLFILATSPSMEHNNTDDSLTPLERHLSSHDAEKEDSPSVVSDVSTITMSTLSSLARDKRKFSRSRRYSASKLYARATGSTSTDEKTSSTPPVTAARRTHHRGRSPIRTVKPSSARSSTPPLAKDRGTPVKSNSSGVKRSTVSTISSHSTTSGSDSGTATTPLSRRAKTLQKAKRVARSRSAERRKSDGATNNVSTGRPLTPTTFHSRSNSVGRKRSESVERKRSESPARDLSPGSVGSAASRAGSRAASIQRARKTLARTKSQGMLKVETSSNTPTATNAAPPAFVAREKVEARARSLSLAPQTRRNLDKRTARLKYHVEFEQEVLKCQQEIGSPPPKHVGGENLIRRSDNGVSIFIRKRPIFDYEIQGGDFDVVFTEERDGHDAIVLYSCNMHADMQQKLVKPTVFSCSAAFDETCTNDMLYNHVGKPLVRLAANGGLATLLTFGQTGSGKTHTITGMEERVCQDLFKMASKFVQVEVQFVELAGNKQVKDLLGTGGDVKLVDQADGSILLFNATSEKARSPEELHNAILRGKQRRATAFTDKNDASSRSHSVLQITITSTKNEKQRGVLSLIDCAGSERRNDSMYHSRERQKESTEINSSLWALKECIRARASGSSSNAGPIPYRSSNLTRILRETLERDDAQLCVIATVAPNATDTEHSIETLKTVSQLTTKDSAMEEMKTRVVTEVKKQLPISPKQWNHLQLVKWMNTKRFQEQVTPGHIDGKQVMRMNRMQLNNAFFGGDNAEGADRMFHALREESEKAYRAQHKSRMVISGSSRVLTSVKYEL